MSKSDSLLKPIKFKPSTLFLYCTSKTPPYSQTSFFWSSEPEGFGPEDNLWFHGQWPIPYCRKNSFAAPLLFWEHQARCASITVFEAHSGMVLSIRVGRHPKGSTSQMWPCFQQLQLPNRRHKAHFWDMGRLVKKHRLVVMGFPVTSACLWGQAHLFCLPFMRSPEVLIQALQVPCVCLLSLLGLHYNLRAVLSQHPAQAISWVTNKLYTTGRRQLIYFMIQVQDQAGSISLCYLHSAHILCRVGSTKNAYWY